MRTSACLSLLLVAAPAFALGPEDIVLVANKNVAASKEVAEHYCTRRGVPIDNVVFLDLPTGEDISRSDYDTRLAGPLRKALADRKDKVKVLLTIYGVPLRVGRAEPRVDEKAELDTVRKDLAAARERLRTVPEEADTVRTQVKELERKERRLTYAESEASVDSELSLLWWDTYELRSFLPNPLYWQAPAKFRNALQRVVMTARLDGPNVEVVKGLVDQAIEVEKKGLAGKVYVDARGFKYTPSEADPGYGYNGYDESLREMARLLEREGKLSVVLDDKEELFAPKSCPDCALYCGWYSLANYVDCCTFAPGAVAYHIASAEAVSLRRKHAKYWCKNLLEHGAVVTVGPVAEPYTLGFPKPAEFFGLLATGKYPVVECYHRTLLFTSWMTVLVGDPLYNPFARKPRLAVDKVKASPAGGTYFIREK